MSYKIAFIGSTEIHESLAQMDPEWDFQVPSPTVLDFANNFNDGIISTETLMVIFFADLFAATPDHFTQTVAYMAQHAVTCILTDPRRDDDPNFMRSLEDSIRDAQSELHSQDEEYNENTPFFIIDYNEPRKGIVEAISGFLTSPIIEEDKKESVSVLMPQVDLEEIEENTEVWDEIDEYGDGPIKIPNVPEGAKGKVIAVTSAKGGSGKSTVSMMLARYLAASSIESAKKGLEPSPLKVLVIDMDTRDGQLSFLNGVKDPSTVIQIFYSGGTSAPIEAIKENVWHSDDMKCDFVFAAKRPRRARDIPPQFYAELIQNARLLYDVIILDTSVNYLDPLLGEVAYPIADRIILVSDVSIASVFGMKRWILENIEAPELEQSERVDASKVGIVINSVLKDVDMGPEKLRAAASGLPILSMIPSVPRLVTYAANTSQLHQMIYNKSINNSFRLLAESIITPEEYKLGPIPIAGMDTNS